MDKLEFDALISDNSVFSLVWSGKYDGKSVAIKMLMLKSGVYVSDDKYYNNGNRISSSEGKKLFKKNDDDPYRHKNFRSHEAVSLDTFMDEVNNLNYLSSKGLSPKCYGYYIDDSRDVHYGFIIMERMDCSVKQVLHKRSLTSDERDMVKKLIDEIHGRKIVHRDLKPSNIGVYLDDNGQIVKCLIFDCQRVLYGQKLCRHKLDYLIKHDWDNFYEHQDKNIRDRIF